MKFKSDTAGEHWSKVWGKIEEGSKWLTPEADVKRWAEGLSYGASILDLGAGEVRRVLKLGGTFMLTMLSKRHLRIDQEKLNSPKEISRNTWLFNDEGSDKRYPH